MTDKSTGPNFVGYQRIYLLNVCVNIVNTNHEGQGQDQHFEGQDQHSNINTLKAGVAWKHTAVCHPL